MSRQILNVIRSMRAKGSDCAAILDAVEAIAETSTDAIEDRRASDRVRKARQRAALKDNGKRHVTSADITGQSEPKPKSTIGTRLPADWSLPDDWLAEARRIAFKAKIPLNDQDIHNEADKFRDYWAAAAGAKGRKCDWLATWRTWVRNGLERRKGRYDASGRGGAGALPQHGRGSIAAAAARRANERQDRADVSDQFDWGDDLAGEGRRNGDDAILIGRSAIGAGGR